MLSCARLPTAPFAPIANRRAGCQPAPQSSIAATKTGPTGASAADQGVRPTNRRRLRRFSGLVVQERKPLSANMGQTLSSANKLLLTVAVALTAAAAEVRQPDPALIEHA